MKFERNGLIKETHEKFKEDLESEGWKVVEEKPKVPVKKSVKKKAE